MQSKSTFPARIAPFSVLERFHSPEWDWCSQGLQGLYNSHQVQSFFYSVPSKVLKADKEIFKPGTARMVSGYQDTKDAFEY